MKQNIIHELVLANYAVTQKIEPNQTLFSLGDACDHYVVVNTGTVRVELLSTSGQQLLLYRIQEGQSCVMTTSCLLGESTYFAQAISETPVELVLIPQAVFKIKLMESPSFQEFVFNGFSERLSAMLVRTADLATLSVDKRLAAALLAHSNSESEENLICLTHEQLAIEIGSAREVVSRRLANFEKNNFIERKRGQIRITDLDKMNQFVSC
jgi:CRP/FNR family transcriptional regulator